jgi:hypothetical protein
VVPTRKPTAIEAAPAPVMRTSKLLEHVG